MSIDEVITKMNIILVGPQGSGKGTQAANIVKEYGLKHLSTGDALRAEIQSGSDLGKEVAELINAGNLVSDDLVNNIIKGAFDTYKEQGLLLDGYPRTQAQAEYLNSVAKVDAILEINISDEEAVRRISARYNCPKCGEIYNTITKPPKVVGVCDNDGAKLFQRDDDKPDEVRKRLADYHAKTEPIIGFFEEKGVAVYHINGEQDFDKVFTDIEEKLD